MANAKSGTLTANVVSTVTVSADGRGIQVVNRTQTGVIWVRLDGVDPVAAADENFTVLGVRHFPTRTGSIQVRLLSTDALAYTVEGMVDVA
jgi:hypothetical protein